MLHVVAGILELDGYILLCQRHRESRRFPLKWEFPGGKVEAGETPADAIRRELMEELGILVDDLEKIEDYDFAYPGEEPFHLHFFRIGAFSNTVQNLQFEHIAWVRPEKLSVYDLLDGDKPFVKNFFYL